LLEIATRRPRYPTVPSQLREVEAEVDAAAVSATLAALAAEEAAEARGRFWGAEHESVNLAAGESTETKGHSRWGAESLSVNLAADESTIGGVGPPAGIANPLEPPAGIASLLEPTAGIASSLEPSAGIALALSGGGVSTTIAATTHGDAVTSAMVNAMSLAAAAAAGLTRDAAVAIARLQNEAVELRAALIVAQGLAGSQVGGFTGSDNSYILCKTYMYFYIYLSMCIYVYMCVEAAAAAAIARLQNEAVGLRAALIVAQELAGSQMGGVPGSGNLCNPGSSP